MGKRWDKPSQTKIGGIIRYNGIGKKDMNITFRKAKRTIWIYEHITPDFAIPPSSPIFAADLAPKVNEKAGHTIRQFYF